MKKRIFDCIAVVSFAMLVLLLADWYHSYQHGEVILFSGPAGRPLIITTGRGLLYVAVANVPVNHSLPWSCDLRSASTDEIEDRLEEAAEVSDLHLGYHMVSVSPTPMGGSATTAKRDAYGFSLVAGKNMLGISGTFYALASIPFWAIVPPLAWISFVWSKTKLQSRFRHRAGCCRNCGYDLRASPQRCPECGTPTIALS